MNEADILKASVEGVSWHNYTKKCKHCGGSNTYRMKRITYNIDSAALSSFLNWVSDAFEGLKKVVKDETG